MARMARGVALVLPQGLEAGSVSAKKASPAALPRLPLRLLAHGRLRRMRGGAAAGLINLHACRRPVYRAVPAVRGWKVPGVVGPEEPPSVGGSVLRADAALQSLCRGGQPDGAGGPRHR